MAIAKKKAASALVETAAPEVSVSPFRAWADRPDDAAISELCQFVVEGGHLAGFAKAKGFAYVTVLDWINSIDRQSEMYARAREDRADVLADEIVAIADDGQNDTYTDNEGNERTNFDVIARSKLRVDARKWAASKLKPRVYGEKQQIDLNNITPRTQEQVDAELAALVAKLKSDGAEPG